MDDELIQPTAADTAPAEPVKEPEMPVTIAAAKPAETEFPMTIDEFCSQLSQHDKRVEIIGGFHYVEKHAGRGKDTRLNYRARFEAFLKQPA